MSAYPSTTTSIDGAMASPATGITRSQAGSARLIKQSFNLDTLLAAASKVANADIVNLFTLPANTVILATLIKTTTIAVGCSSTCTAKLRFTTTDIGATCDILTKATAVGGNATVALPLNVGTSDVLVNLVFAIGGGTTTTNPTISVQMLVCDMSS